MSALCIRLACVYFFFFFFSSKQKHTRSDRDWSSDVCSSDLKQKHTRSDRDWSSDVCSSDLKQKHTRSDRKSTRLNSSHDQISYAVFCLRSEKHTSELQYPSYIVCRPLLELPRQKS